MNSQSKFLATMNFEWEGFPIYEFGYWAATVRRWYGEGLAFKRRIPSNLADGDGVWGFLEDWRDKIPRFEDLDEVIAFDKPLKQVPFYYWVYPEFEITILEEDKEKRVFIDEMGIKKRINKSNDSIPEYLEWPVKDKESWEKFKHERLNPMTPGRFPSNFGEIALRLCTRDYPLLLSYGPVGFFGSLRYLLGEVNLMIGYYDFPSLINEIVSYLADFWIQLWSNVFSVGIKPDCVFLWEDMSYKNGSLISPDTFREFMLPAYKKITSFLRENGLNIIFVDTDGNCWDLIPLFLEGGVTGLFPMEVAANMKVEEIRKHFPRLQIMGGIDKRALIEGNESIDLEVERIKTALRGGGYIPFVDHLVPPDVSFKNYLYFRERLKELSDYYI